jgi:hypothetical protein
MLMKNLLVVFAVALSALFAGSAQAASVSTTASLTGSAVSSTVAVPVAPYAWATGSLTVEVEGDFSAIPNATVFVALESLNVGSVREIGNSVSATKMVKTFTIGNGSLLSLLADSLLTFKFNSSTPSDVNPYSVKATLSYASVPEPTTLAILGLGALGAVAARRRRK